MSENNKEYQAVIGSVVLHLLVIWALIEMPFLDLKSSPKKDASIDIEILQKDDYQSLVKSLLKPEEKKPDSKAKFLGAQINRVPREMVSPRRGETRNAFKPSKIKKFGIEKKDLAAGALQVPKKLPTLEYTRDLQSQFSFDLDKIQYGAVTLLNSDYSIYASFYDRISPTIRYEWLRRVSTYLSDPVIAELMRLNKDVWSTRVEVILDKKGNLTDTILVNSSGSSQLDIAPTEGFQTAAPFINPPEAIVSEDGKIHLHYMFVVRFDPRYFARTKKQ